MIPAMVDDPGHGGISRTVTIHGLFSLGYNRLLTTLHLNRKAWNFSRDN